MNHLDAVRAPEEIGLRIARQGKHIVLTDGIRVVVLPGQDPIHSITVGRNVRDLGMTNDEFRALL